MPRYTVVETVEYEVEADSVEDAIAVIVNADDLNAFFSAVTERDAYPLQGDGDV